MSLESHRQTDGDSRPDRWPWSTTVFEDRFGNGLTRVVVAVFGIPLLLWIFWLGGGPFTALVFVLTLGMVFEYSNGARKSEFEPFVVTLIAATVLVQGTTALVALGEIAHDVAALLLLGTVLLLMLAGGLLSLRFPGAVAARRFASTTFAAVWIVVPMASIVLIRSLFEPWLMLVSSDAAQTLTTDAGFTFLMLVFVGIWLTDTGAYLVGRAVGRRKLAPTISPNKSIEGAFGGLVLGTAAVVAMSVQVLPELPIIHALVLGPVIGILGQIGDLFESHMKRTVGIKDSSAIIPGHGGLLDRFDSLLFVGPAVSLYMIIVVGSRLLT